MGKLKIYGPLKSRARRALWVAREIGQDFDQVSLDMAAKEHKSAAYLKVNPNGKVPAIDDNGYVLWESFAINLYLAKKYDSPIKPKSLDEEGKILQWTFFAATEFDPTIVQYGMHTDFLDPEQRIPRLVEEALVRFKTLMDVLEGALSASPYVLGDHFSLADLNLACAVGFAKRIGIDLSPWSKSKAWLDRCLSRPQAIDQQ